MINNRKFSDLHDHIDYDGLEVWCEQYYSNLMGMLNSFLSRVEPREVIERLQQIPIENMVDQELEQELDAVRNHARQLIRELLDDEITNYKAYLEF